MKLIARSKVNHLGVRERGEREREGGGEREKGKEGDGGREKGKEGDGGREKREEKKREEGINREGSNITERDVTRITLTHSCTLPQKLISLLK